VSQKNIHYLVFYNLKKPEAVFWHAISW